ncbi:threonine/homoserine/homoserine lactone efflux protein [Aliiruegeria haliotis]|uniref:Threonine/homoserine/homoserine lactone efflux protein n=1 Tax=Aliiruegeria haliotis TaxID=1280846 RepID=A0A2T0RM37_9RHOB|nr:LysE family translocator [Aliiruegeria haliotis]PRY22249.1 threonine/homoserine/homoserine lactone efflux protein [Aliiruegeria haliotis]
MPSLHTWIVFVPAALALAVYPGPNNLLSLATAAQQGFRKTVLAGAGRLAAFALLIAACGIGMGALLAASETYFTVLKWIGGLYLVFLGLRMAHSASGSSATPEAPFLPWWQLARQDFLVALTNPKAILVFTAFFPQFLAPTESIPLQFAVLGAAFLGLQLVAISTYAAAGARLGRFVSSGPGRTWLNRATGVTLVSAGLILSTAHR